jgi:putative two-component system response regulator
VIAPFTDARILMIDDEETNLLLMRRLLEAEGYTDIIWTQRSDEAVALFEALRPDLLLLDLQMPPPDGFAVMRLLRPHTAVQTYVPILVLTADAAPQTRRRALDEGASDFLTKPLDAAEVSLRIRNLLNTRRLQLQLQASNQTLAAELEQSRAHAFGRLALAGAYRDDATRRHTTRVANIAGALARELGFDAAMQDAMRAAAPLHDLGKIGIPDAILLKRGRLDEHEFATMKEHAAIGAKILSGDSASLFAVAADIALTHHERWDGTGYPGGLAEDAIPLTGRIVALADAFDAMSNERPYKRAMPAPAVRAEIDRCSGSHFDPAVVRAFRRLDAERLAC